MIFLLGKHVNIECPKYGGSYYFNYKGFHSTVLMAICDSKYRFIYANMGSYGRDNDASIFSQTEIYDLLDKEKLNVPEPDQVLGSNTPYYLVGDDIFALKPWLMKPYSGGCNIQQEVFNYRLSRARRTIENTFGIMSARWRIFCKPIRADINTVDGIVQACVVLHNYLMTTENARYTPSGFIDSQTAEGIVEGDWRKIVQHDANVALHHPGRIATRNYNFESKLVRQSLTDYVNSEEGEARCPWQKAHVTNSGRNRSNNTT